MEIADTFASGTWLERQETYGAISGDCVRQGARRSLLDVAQIIFDILRKLLSAAANKSGTWQD